MFVGVVDVEAVCRCRKVVDISTQTALENIALR